MKKTLVLYVFHIFNERVQHFIDHCIFKDDFVDFFIICNDLEIEFYVPDYVFKLHRENIGYDFGGWSDALLENNIYINYDYFIFVNSSVIGPFLPVDYSGKWTDIYIHELTDNIKLFGSTINTINNPLRMAHVQSYIFSMNRETLIYLIDCDIFSLTNYTNNYSQTVYKKEVLMSRKIIEAGWNIGSLLKRYHGVDFTFKDKQPSDYKQRFISDITSERFRRRWWFEDEVVFIKGNRTNDPIELFNQWYK